MHRAPAASFPVLRSRWHLRALIAFLVLSAAASTAFVWSDPVASARWALVLPAMGAAAVLAGVQWMRSPQGVLRWDGGQWFWETESQTEPCTVRLALDFQKAMVVHLRCEPGTSAVRWLEAGAAPQRWQALRRALVSQTLHPLVPSDQAPSNGIGGRS